MTSRIVPLQHPLHRDLHVDARALARNADDRFVQVVVREFELLAVHYPILLSKDADTGQFFCGAMLGIDPGENLFAAEGGSAPPYRPLNQQRMPFFAAEAGLAIDLDNPHVDTAPHGEMLFEEDGSPTAFLRAIAGALEVLRAGIEETRAFVDALLAHGLVAPIDIALTFDDGTSRELEGLYTIDREAMGQLPDAAVLALFRAGYLQLAYTMIGSLRQIPVLAGRKNDRMAAGAR